MQKILHTFKFCDHNFNYVQIPSPDSWSVTHEIFGIAKEDEEFLFLNEDLNNAVFEYGRSIWLSKRDEIVSREYLNMTIEDAKNIKVGDTVLFRGHECLVRKIMFYGNDHPYFIIAGRKELSISMRQHIGKSPYSYSLCGKI